MVGVLGLLTGWALLMPALLVLYLRIGLPYAPWMSFFLGIAVSFPLLVCVTTAGLAAIFFSVRSLTRRAD